MFIVHVHADFVQRRERDMFMAGVHLNQFQPRRGGTIYSLGWKR